MIPVLHQAIGAIIEIKFGEAGQNLSARVDRIKQPKVLQDFVEKIKKAQSLSEAEKIFSTIRSNGHKANGANGRNATKTKIDRGK